MKPDPIVEEVRKVREAHAAKFGYDLAAICGDLRGREKNANHPLVRRPPEVAIEKDRKLSPHVMEKVDEKGKVLGFSVMRVRALHDVPMEAAL
jgi:hypothetical protein